MKNNQAEQNLKDNILAPQMMKRGEPGYGIILAYSRENNTATVLASRPNSDQPGETYHNVACPYTPGIQGVGPEPGTMCWIAFKDGNQAIPMVVAFFKYDHRNTVYERQYRATNDTPQFMMEM